MEDAFHRNPDGLVVGVVLRNKAIKPLLAATQPLHPARGAHNPKPIGCRRVLAQDRAGIRRDQGRGLGAKTNFLWVENEGVIVG